jgi:plasmid replication initiation protein
MRKKTIVTAAQHIDPWMSMSNRLIRAGQGLSLAEKRIVMLAVSKLDSKKPIVGSFSTKIMAADYAKSFNVSADTAYDQLQEASNTLHKRCITSYEAAYRRNGKPLPPTIVRMSWVGQVKYQHGEGWVELFWTEHIAPHLVGLKAQFTSYQLSQTTALRSIYSWRLLELLMRFKTTGWAEYTVEDFNVSMDVPKDYINDFGQVKRSIIEPAVRELIKKDHWKIEWNTTKAGRKVKSIRFDFSR